MNLSIANHIKKTLKASSLIEVIIATVILLIMFTISTYVFANFTQKRETQNIYLVQQRMHELTYLIKNKRVETPYSEYFSGWEINCSKTEFIHGVVPSITVSAVNESLDLSHEQKTWNYD